MPPDPAADGIARWPKIAVTLNDDGTGRLTIDGRVEDISAPDVDAARVIVLERVTATARTVGRPVRLQSSDPDGQWELAVHPDGHVDELDARPASAPPPVAAPASLPRVTPRAHAGLGRRGLVRLTVALAIVIGAGSVATLVVTNGPATVVEKTTPAPPRARPAPPTTSDRAAEIAAAQRAAARREAARARREHRAVEARVAARQARERRAARRRAAARRQAAQARRRAALARKRAKAPPRPTSRAPQRPVPVAPPPPPPPPPPARPACDDFDLC
jgi:hypothetical protein